MTPRIAAASLVLLLALPVAAATRITYDVNGKPTAIEWAASAFPLRYEVDRRLAQANPNLPAMIDRAFEAWASIPDANIRFESRGVVGELAARNNDGRIVVSLADELFKGQGALAMTTYTFDPNGRFTDADIQIDPSLLKGNFNVDSALRHEVGHLLGLDHSAVLSAVMFPFITSGGTPTGLDSDDRIAIAAAYPRQDPILVGATLQGRVLGDSGAIFAAQVVAVNAHGEPVATALTSSSGEFMLVGIPSGRYRIYAEPLDGPVDLTSFQGTWRQAKPLSFRTQFYEGPPFDIENGKVYGNLVVTTGGTGQINPRWAGRTTAGNLNFQNEPVTVYAGETVTLGIAGEGFISGMTQFEVLNPAFRRVSDFSWGGNYVTATFIVHPEASPTSAVVLVQSGRESATLTGAMRVQRGAKKRATRS